MHGVFGYKSVADHWHWRSTAEHAQVVKEMSDGLKEFDMQPASVPGGGLFVKEAAGMFHVELQKGLEKRPYTSCDGT